MSKKGGVKQEDKVNQRIGRLKQKYPSIQRYFDIGTEVHDQPETKRKKKVTEPDNAKKQIVSAVKWAVIEGVDINARSGVYFLRTSLQAKTEKNVWQFYNTIRDIEIVRTMNTQKAVTTLAQNNHEEVILIRRCSEPNQQVRKLYDALKFKYAPFVKRKSVVHKSELENCQFIEKQQFRSD